MHDHYHNSQYIKKILIDKYADEEVYHNALLYALNNSDLDLAKYIYAELMGDPLLHPTLSTFNMLLRYYSSKKSVEGARSVWLDILARNITPDMSSFTALIPLFIRGDRQDGDSLHKLIDATNVFDLRTTYEFYEKFTQIFVNLRKGYSPVDIIAEMKEQGITVRYETFERLIKIYSEQKKIDEVEIVLDLMEEHGIKMNKMILYNLMSTYNNINEPKSALKIYTKMMVTYRMYPNQTVMYEFFRSYHLLEQYDTLFRFYDNLIKSRAKFIGTNVFTLLFEIIQANPKFKSRAESILNDIILGLSYPDEELIIKMIETFTQFKEMKNVNVVFKYASQHGIQIKPAVLSKIKAKYI